MGCTQVCAIVQRMNLSRTAAAALALTIALTSCGTDSKSESEARPSDTNSTSASAVAGTAAETTADTSTSEGESGTSTGDPLEFCQLLVDQRAGLKDFASKLGGPKQDVVLAEVRASNELITRQAPAEIKQAVELVNELTELSQEVFTSADQNAATNAAAEAASTPEAAEAYASYSAWVAQNCGELSDSILLPGT